MVDIAIGITPFVAGTISADLTAAAGQLKSVQSTEFAVIDADGDTSDITVTAYSAGAATLIFVAGANPPSTLALQGNNATQTLTAGKTHVITIPAGRFVQSNGTVRILLGAATAIIGAFRAAREQ